MHGSCPRGSYPVFQQYPKLHCVRSKKVKSKINHVRAEPLPLLNTKSIGHPQFTSMKSILPAHSRERTSAVGTRFAGLFPATCTPKIDSEGCRRTSDHSSFEPERKDEARPTGGLCKLLNCIRATGRRTLATGDVSTEIDAKAPERQVPDRRERCKVWIILLMRNYGHLGRIFTCFASPVQPFLLREPHSSIGCILLQ
jgi:hypothetical protein